MESYFRLDTPLYFSYSHLVCRTAIEGGPPSPRSPRPPGRPRPRHWTRRRAGTGPFILLGNAVRAAEGVRVSLPGQSRGLPRGGDGGYTA